MQTGLDARVLGAFQHVLDRVIDNTRLAVEARLFVGIDGASPLAGIRRDDYVALGLSRFF